MSFLNWEGTRHRPGGAWAVLIRIGSVIAWASFELPKGNPRYRAGVEFLDGDQALVQKVIDTNRKK